MTIDATPPKLFDRALRARRRERAARSGAFDDAAYLHAAAAESVADRLAGVGRRFRRAAVFGAADGAYARAIAALPPDRGVEEVVQVDAAPTLAARAGGAAVDPLDWTPDVAAFDLAIYGLELHAADDPIGALTRARLALEPDGLLIAACLCGETLSEWRRALIAAEVEASGGASPRIAPMADLSDLSSALQRAGFALPVADLERTTIWHGSPLAALADVRAMGEGNALLDRARAPLRRGVLLDAARRVAAGARADGKTPTTIDIAYLTGWAPSADQPKPLRPGSATTRLADALGAEETPLPRS